MQRSRGFTLIELAVTLAIASILAGVALPSLQDLLERQRAAAVVGSLTAHMGLARVAAVTHNRRSVLCPTADGHTCHVGTDWSRGWMLFLDEDGNRRPDAGDDVLRVDLAPTSRHLQVRSTRGREQLRYLPDGRSAGSNLTISVCGAQGQVVTRVIVNNMGRPRSERPAKPTACPG